MYKYIYIYIYITHIIYICIYIYIYMEIYVYIYIYIMCFFNSSGKLGKLPMGFGYLRARYTDALNGFATLPGVVGWSSRDPCNCSGSGGLGFRVQGSGFAFNEELLVIGDRKMDLNWGARRPRHYALRDSRWRYWGFAHRLKLGAGF